MNGPKQLRLAVILLLAPTVMSCAHRDAYDRHPDSLAVTGSWAGPQQIEIGDATWVLEGGDRLEQLQLDSAIAQTELSCTEPNLYFRYFAGNTLVAEIRTHWAKDCSAQGGPTTSPEGRGIVIGGHSPESGLRGSTVWVAGAEAPFVCVELRFTDHEIAERVATRLLASAHVPPAPPPEPVDDEIVPPLD